MREKFCITMLSSNPKPASDNWFGASENVSWCSLTNGTVPRTFTLANIQMAIRIIKTINITSNFPVCSLLHTEVHWQIFCNSISLACLRGLLLERVDFYFIPFYNRTNTIHNWKNYMFHISYIFFLDSHL